MAVITKDERKVIQQRLMAAGSPILALIYGEATEEDADWVLTQPPAVAVVKLIGRLSEDAAMAITVCDALVGMLAKDPGNLALAAIADRLRAQKALASVNPMQELWIGSEPMVDRSALRAILQEIVSGHDHGVIYVAGNRMSGRSHSFQLIRHVADSMNIPRYKVDFLIETDARTLPHLYGSLRKAFDINAEDEPTYEGATPGDVASKYAARLRAHLASAPPVNPRPWIVIDFSEEVPDLAVPEFLRILCSNREANHFINCVIFILGPTAHLDSMRGDLLKMQVEELGPVAQPDILAATLAVNQRGSQQLENAELEVRAEKIYDELVKLQEDARFPALRQSLLKLRSEVRAP